MADTKNTEVPPASEPVAPVQAAPPVTVVRERRSWVAPLLSALIIVAALVVGGIGGFALARAVGHDAARDGRPALEQGEDGLQGQFPGGAPNQGGQQVGPPQGGQGSGPGRPGDDGDSDTSGGNG